MLLMATHTRAYSQVLPRMTAYPKIDINLKLRYFIAVSIRELSSTKSRYGEKDTHSQLLKLAHAVHIHLIILGTVLLSRRGRTSPFSASNDMAMLNRTAILRHSIQRHSNLTRDPGEWAGNEIGALSHKPVALSPLYSAVGEPMELWSGPPPHLLR